MATRHKTGDRIIPVAQAGTILLKELGIKGWSRPAIRSKIQDDWKFKWEEGVHYIRTAKGVAALNVDAIKREIIK